MLVRRLRISLILLAACVSAHADTLATFNIQGASVFYGLAGDQNTLSGTTIIDTTDGLVQSISFTAGGSFQSGVDAQPFPFLVDVGASGAVFTFTGTTLVDYDGSTFNLRGPNDFYVGSVDLVSTSTTGPVAITPEPSSLLLLGSGLLGAVGVLRRRRHPRSHATVISCSTAPFA